MPSVPRLDSPPSGRESYVIEQLGGEKITIPGSKSVFRILTSALQSDGTISVFTMDGALADAPGFHHHNEAHDIFMVTKGFLKVWNGDKCKILGPGDFASVPPGVVHNPETLGPITETVGLIHPAAWIDFFRYITEPFDGILFPELDDRNLREVLLPKVMAAPKDKYDVHFHPHHIVAPVSEWSAEDEVLPDGLEPFYLKANRGPRWLL